MKYAFVLLALFVSPALAAEKTPDVSSALKAWVDAVESNSAENIAALYDKDAVMISTFAQKPITTHEALMGYYKKVVANPDAKVDVIDQHPRSFGSLAVNSGLYTFHYTEDGEPVTVPARFSFTYKLEGGKWVIVDHHSSRIPMASEAK